MNHKAKQAAIWASRGVFKALALVGAFVLIIGLWLWDASLLTKAADGNLRLIREITRSYRPIGPASRKARYGYSALTARFS